MVDIHSPVNNNSLVGTSINTEEELAKLVATVPFFKSASIKKIEGIAAGKNNLNLRVNVGKNSFFLKFFHVSEVQAIDRRQEYLILQRVYNAGLGVRPVAFDLRSRSMVTEFIDLSTWTLEEIRVDSVIQMFGRLLRQLHRMSSVNSAYLIQDLLQRYWTVLSNSEGGAKIVKQVVDFFQQTQMSLDRFHCEDDIKFCHNDFYYENLLRGLQGKTALVLDWEMAGMNDFYFELAGFIHFHQLDRRQTELFIQAYTQDEMTPISINWQKLSVHQDAVLLRELLWVNTKLQEGCTDPFYVDYKRRCLNAVLRKQQSVR